MQELIKIILVILISSIKFIAGPPFAYYNDKYNFTFFETVFYCVIGGTLGVVVFTFFSRALFGFWNYIKLKIKKVFKKKQVFSEPKVDIDSNLKINYEYLSSETSKKALFTKRNRKLIWLWRKYGLFGIALITPIILSIPIGTIIANSLVNNRKKVIIYMFFSVLFWSITMTTLFELFHADSVKVLQEHISE